MTSKFGWLRAPATNFDFYGPGPGARPFRFCSWCRASPAILRLFTSCGPRPTGCFTPESAKTPVSRFFRIASVYRNPRSQRFALNYLDPYLAGRSCERAVSRNQRGIQRFSKSQISCIISREIVAHLPDAGEQHEMGIAGERKIEEVGESLGAPFRRDAGGRT
jgi:hypothetical protein